jgi:putative flippase GtrA
MKLFLGFVLISGVGWLLDMASYAGLSQFFTLPLSFANFISSMVGVTYVWIVALNRLFDRREYGRSIYLPIYWGYQGISILAYSALISIVAASAFNLKIEKLFEVPSALVAKIVITAPNLITNFIFMSFLAGLMKSSAKQKYLS